MSGKIPYHTCDKRLTCSEQQSNATAASGPDFQGAATVRSCHYPRQGTCARALYNELALGNEAFQSALEVLDDDMPTYVNRNTRNELSHQDARPCKFISSSLPLRAVIRPTSMAKGGAMAAATGLTQSWLFNGQSNGFFKALFGLAAAADATKRGFEED